MSDEPKRDDSGRRSAAGKARAIVTLVLRPFRAAGNWAGHHRAIGMIVAMLLGSTLIVGTLAVCVSRFRFQAPKTPLREAFAALDEGQYAHARQIATEVRQQASRDAKASHAQSPEAKSSDAKSPDAGLHGSIAFVLGASAAYEAESLWDERYASKFYLVASRYLEKSRDAGWPAGRQAEGLLLLGKSLQESGRHEQCVPVLEEALTAAPGNAAEILARLVRANLQRDPPDYAAALRWNQQQLAEVQLSEDMRHSATYQQCEILYRLGQFDACRKSLEAVLPDWPCHPAALLLQARILLDEGDRQGDDASLSQAKYQEALGILRRSG